jgi:hypothetical protein
MKLENKNYALFSADVFREASTILILHNYEKMKTNQFKNLSYPVQCWYPENRSMNS